MRWSGGVNRACKLAGVLAIAFALAACSRQQPQRNMGLGDRRGRPRRGRRRNFAVNVGDVVHFQEDSSDLTGEAPGHPAQPGALAQPISAIHDHRRRPCRRAGNARIQPRARCPARHGGQSLPGAVGRERGPDPHDVLRQGAADRDLRRAVLLEPESARADGPQRPRRGRRPELLAEGPSPSLAPKSRANALWFGAFGAA